MQVRELVINEDFTLKKLWDGQHPIIHTWFVLSSISLCFMSALFFIIP